MIQYYVLDTNIITALLRQEKTVQDNIAKALVSGDELLLCPVVFFEVYRGLLYRDAKRQLASFLNLARWMASEPLGKRDWEHASHLWATLRQGGHQVADADLLIGTYAAVRGAIVVTDNEKHFSQLGVVVENWRR